MISAVAARRAAKAPAPSLPPDLPPPPSSSPSPSPRPVSLEKKSSSKRTYRRSGPSRNKRSKVAALKPDRHARYFDQSEKTIDVDPSSSSSSSEGEMNIIPQVESTTVVVTETKRAWSPSRPVGDSSDEEVEVITTNPTPATSAKSLVLSTFRATLDSNVFTVSENGKAVIFVLQPNETVALVGTYSLRVLQGSLSLFGVTLPPSDVRHTVFAPRSSPIPVLSWVPCAHKSTCTFPIPPAVQQQPNTTAILVEYLHTGVEGLGRICKTFENAFNPPRESNVVPGIDQPRLYIVNHSTKDIFPFLLPSSWEAALASVQEQSDTDMSTPPICLVKGSKKSGKSTLARTLANRLLSRYRRVAFLECDLGQSEFTPGGLVALNVVENYVFGPPFTHPSLPYRAHYVGATSPRANPSYYLHSIQSLLETYRLELQFLVSTDQPPIGDERIYDAIPLVVNTMGWTKGLGADLNTRIEEFVEALHTFDIDGTEDKGWPSIPQSEPSPVFSTAFSSLRPSIKKCLTVEAIRPEMTSTYYTATDHRHVNVMSYFHAVFPEYAACSSPSRPSLKQITPSNWDTSAPLCARYPYEVDYTQAFDRIYLTGAGCEDVVPSELMRVLNGAVVGLVSTGPTIPRPTQPVSREQSLPYTPAEPPPDPTLSTCHGLALIRGIPLSPNARSLHMHVLTPLPMGLVAQSRVVVKGEMELPIWGMLDFREEDEGRVAGVEKGQVPYLQWGKGEGIGGEKWRVRRNLMRKTQI